MAATPFKGTITIRYDDGDIDIQPFDATDVVAEVVKFVNTGLSFYQTKSKYGYIIDFSLSAAGVDTSILKIRINSRDTGLSYLDTGIIASVDNRVPGPPRIGPSIQLQLEQH